MHYLRKKFSNVIEILSKIGFLKIVIQKIMLIDIHKLTWQLYLSGKGQLFISPIPIGMIQTIDNSQYNNK